MSYGFEVYDESGNINYELSEGTCIYDSTKVVPSISGGSSYTLSVPGYNPSTWFFIMFSGIPYYAVTVYPKSNEIEILVTSAISSLDSFEIDIYRSAL